VLERPLSEAERNLYDPYFQPETLAIVRIVDGKVPFWLCKNMCAVVLGHCIYLRAELDRPRAYQAGSPSGVELLAHEITHVEQYLSGMTVLKYLWASRRGYRNNPYEIEAYAKGRFVARDVVTKKSRCARIPSISH
jgi:hypothetical protein